MKEGHRMLSRRASASSASRRRASPLDAPPHLLKAVENHADASLRRMSPRLAMAVGRGCGGPRSLERGRGLERDWTEPSRRPPPAGGGCAERRAARLAASPAAHRLVAAVSVRSRNRNSSRTTALTSAQHKCPTAGVQSNTAGPAARFLSPAQLPSTARAASRGERRGFLVLTAGSVPYFCGRYPTGPVVAFLSD
jgi:hypothetical protein